MFNVNINIIKKKYNEEKKKYLQIIILFSNYSL